MDKAREIAIDICSIFEDLLDEYDITIDTEERKEYIKDMDEKEASGVARLFGEVYYYLEDSITKIINDIL